MVLRFIGPDQSLMFVLRVTDDTAETDVIVPQEVMGNLNFSLVDYTLPIRKFCIFLVFTFVKNGTSLVLLRN